MFDIKIKKTLSVVIIIILAISSLFLLILYPLLGKSKMNIRNGVWNSQSWSAENYPTSTLGGEWEFYWQRLLYEENFKQNSIPDAYVQIPSVWNNYAIGGQGLPGFGYATYRLHVVNGKAGKPLAIRMSPLSTSYRMYINQKLVAKCGEVGTKIETSKPEYKAAVIQFTPESSSYDIIIQVSNFTYSRGGMWYAPQIGTDEKILKHNNLIWYRDVFLFGSFAAMLFFSGCLYAFGINSKSNFYFAVICTSIIFRTIVYGSYLITSWSLFTNLNIIVRMDYISTGWFTMALLLLMNEQFSPILKQRHVKAIVIIAIIFSLFVLCTPIYIFTKTIYPLEIVAILTFLYILLIIIQKFINGEKGAFILLSSLIFLYISGFHDLLLQNNNIAGGSIEMIPMGFFLLLICEEYLIARKYSDTIAQNEKTFFEIEEISERERNITIKFLKSQINPHFIHNALNTIISISRRDSEKARELLVHFSKYLRSCFDFEDLDKTIPLEKELELVYSYIAIEKARYGENLKVDYDLEETNSMIPPFLLLPLVENAIENGVRKSLNVGEIVIYIKKQEQILIIGVKNTGEITQNQENIIFYENTEAREAAGLSNINQKLNKLYGTSLITKSIPTGGMDIYMKLPLEERKP